MRTSPNLRDEYDVKELLKLKAEKWQIDLLEKNPNYVHWGNYEDYMSDKDSGWRSPIELERFSDTWGLDELNELVNFYFTIYRENHECPHCEGQGLNPKTLQISEDWYDFNQTGRRWCNDINDEEVEALVKSGRISDLMDSWYTYDEKKDVWKHLDRSVPHREREWVECEKPTMPTAKEVNDWNRGKGLGHEAINRWICVETRAKSLGVYGKCEHCEGGYIYDDDKAKVALQMWYILPRKGTSRGVYVKEIKEEELTDVFNYLKEGAKRNQERFSKI